MTRDTLTQPVSRSSTGLYWRHAVMLAIIVGSLTAMFLQPPFGQDQNYHAFADSRGFLGIPNFGDVASNLGFFVVGLLGLRISLIHRLGPLRNAWIVMFAGISLVGVASSYYHWSPNDQTLVPDRITLTVGFMGLFVGLLGEYVHVHLRLLLIPAILTGAYSVLHWHWFQDLRLYYWIQLIPLLVLPIAMVLYRPTYSHQWLVLSGGILYGLAKLAELGDRAVFTSTQGIISGHTIKHLLAAMGCWTILIALQNRKPAG
jgi:hypothetical protein